MLYLNGHNYKYAAEQMLLSPRDGTCLLYTSDAADE